MKHPVLLQERLGKKFTEFTIVTDPLTKKCRLKVLSTHPSFLHLKEWISVTNVDIDLHKLKDNENYLKIESRVKMELFGALSHTMWSMGYITAEDVPAGYGWYKRRIHHWGMLMSDATQKIASGDHQVWLMNVSEQNNFCSMINWSEY